MQEIKANPTNLTPEKPKLDRETLKKQIKHMQAKDREMVRGIFRFHEVPGGTMEFVYGPVYKGDKTDKYTLVDGQICTLPLGVAKHLNKNVWYPVHGFMQNEQGHAHVKINQRVRRCSFQSLEFVDVEDLTPNSGLIQVTEISGTI